MAVPENLVRSLGEDLDVALVVYREAMNGNTVELTFARPVLIMPGDVIARAGGQNVDVGMAGEMFRDVAGMQLRATVDVGAVSLHDDGELHCSDGSRPSSSPE